MSYRFTIFTPSYNRAHTLPKVYASIQGQTFRDFEWLIVDDGSSDNTRDLVAQWSSEATFPIHYVYQRNGHKKTAINTGVKHAQGELFLILDSDDEMLPSSLQVFNDAWQAIPEVTRGRYAGVTGLCIDQSGELVGSTFPSDLLDSDAIGIRYEHKVSGEKWGFNTTAVMRLFPFPEDIPGLVPEALIWNRIAKEYQMRFINQVVRIYHDEGDSISRTSVIKNTPGFRLFYHESLCNEWTRILTAPIAIFKLAANTVRYDLHCQDMRTINPHAFGQCGLGAKLIRWLAYPVAFWQYQKDKRQAI
jgi:glycosyltransferase involved in cell wall biosynthesis